MKPLLLLTGGTGTVGQLLLPGLRRRYRLRITLRTGERSRPDGVIDADELHTGDLTDADFCRRAVNGCAAVLHLAANASPSATVGEAFANVDLAVSVLAAAEEFAVPHVVVASSVHASGLDYRDGLAGIGTGTMPRPCCAYGAGKVAVEAMARLHQDANQNAVSCLRLGLTGWPLEQRQYAHTWLSAADLRRLVDAALSRSAGFGIYNAVSADAATRWDTGNALADLGWSPQDRWELDPEQLPMANSCPCQMFTVPSASPLAPQLQRGRADSSS